MAALPVRAVAEAPKTHRGFPLPCRLPTRRPRTPITVLPGSGLPVFGAERSRSVDNWLRQQVAAAHIGHRRLAALQVDGLDGLRGHLAAVGGLGAGDDFLAVGGNQGVVFEFHADSY